MHKNDRINQFHDAHSYPNSPDGMGNVLEESRDNIQLLRHQEVKYRNLYLRGTDNFGTRNTGYLCTEKRKCSLDQNHPETQETTECAWDIFVLRKGSGILPIPETNTAAGVQVYGDYD